ncbi:hypothetical protein M011DRAFT_480706 [Sporormia fimetaria CBS 119925]|uniref:Uncharacterized protein n=1 Tax=Sporormia fimetaria CBS 119925 TaxID=1340428 RepID=A0A6A6V1E9_9PLEO|nr:hypothetical protein M011DRAFT_480706 [Sporormia fimetaria CBS 119925]
MASEILLLESRAVENRPGNGEAAASEVVEGKMDAVEAENGETEKEKEQQKEKGKGKDNTQELKNPMNISNVLQSNSDTASGVEDKSGTGATRKRAYSGPRYETCVQCEAEFDVLSNEDGACVWHPGSLRRDLEQGCWDDCEEHMYEDAEFYLIDEVPEGYEWVCCKRRSNEEGCMKGRHEAEGSKKNKSGGC